MDFKQLQCFVSVAQALNFTKAAEKLYISQPALSRQIFNLEEELGVHLFRRDRRVVELTPSGIAFLPEAEKIINQIQLGTLIAKNAEKEMVGTLRIGILGDDADDNFHKIISNYRKKYPHVNLVFSEYSASGMAYALQKGKVDVIFAFLMDVLDISEIVWEKTCTDHLCVVMSQDHPLSYKEYICVSELKNERLVLIDKKDSLKEYNEVINLFAKCGCTPTIIASVRLIPSLLNLVAGGAGVSILPSTVKNIAPASLRFVPLEINGCSVPVDRVVAWRRDNTNSHLFCFVEELIAILGTNA